MSSDGGWHRSGRHETGDLDPRGDRDDGYDYSEALDGYQSSQPGDRGWRQDGYDRPGRHGTHGGYGAGDGYDHRDYGSPAGYGEQAGYGSDGNGSSYGQSSRGSYGRDSYGSYGEDSYRRDAYGHDEYGAADPYGQPSRSSGHRPDGGQGWEQIGQTAGPGPRGDADTTSAYRMPPYTGSDEPLPARDSGRYREAGAFGSRDTDSYDAADTGSYGRTGLYDPLEASSARTPGADPYDRGDYAPGHPYDPAGSGVYDWADSGSFDVGDPPPRHDRDAGRFGEADAGTFWGPGTGERGRSRTGSYDAADSGSFDPADSASFDRPGTGTFGRAAGQAPSRGQVPASHEEGYASWHDDPDDGEALWGAQDDDVWDDDDEPRSGRFSGGDRGDHGGRGGRGGAARGRRDRGKRPKRTRGRVASSIALVIVFAVIGGAGLVGFVGYKFVHSWITHRYGDYTGSGTGTVKITVPQGSSLVGLGPMLLRDDVIMALRPYDSAAGQASNANSLQPGTYLLHHHMNSALVVRMLLSGKTRVNNSFTVYPDWRAAKIAAELAKHTKLPLSQFTQIIEHPTAALGLPNWASGHSAEGFLFPDTYRLAPNQTPLQILQGMVKDFSNRTASLSLPSAAAKVYTTPFHIMVVASLIQAEGNATDFSKISRVIWNRLKNNMPLQFDSTVFYAMHKYGTAITKAQEKYPSPYNTYLHTGLPPGPIGSPGLTAIRAALHPAQGNWLYFITDVKSPTHKTYFTDSLTQFQQWQRQFES